MSVLVLVEDQLLSSNDTITFLNKFNSTSQPSKKDDDFFYK